MDYSVYLVTDRPLCLGRDLLDVVRQAVAGGATVVQLREKDTDTRKFVELGRAMKTVLDEYGVPLIINDRLDVALAVKAAGAHIGQSDMPYALAREIMGPDAVIGLSVETLDHVRQAEDWDVDYLGVGPIFPTKTKADASPAWGMDGFARAKVMSRHKLVAIGSVTADNAPQLIRAGADGVAVVSAICSATSPREAAENLADAIARARRE